MNYSPLGTISCHSREKLARGTVVRLLEESGHANPLVAPCGPASFPLGVVVDASGYAGVDLWVCSVATAGTAPLRCALPIRPGQLVTMDDAGLAVPVTLGSKAPVNVLGQMMTATGAPLSLGVVKVGPFVVSVA